MAVFKLLESDNAALQVKLEDCRIYSKGELDDWDQTLIFHYPHDEDYKNVTRKLSLTLQLSDPNTYEGGKFLLFNGEHEPSEPPIREQGSIIVFDSRLWHKVTPVTKGVRYSLVSWVLGPHFR